MKITLYQKIFYGFAGLAAFLVVAPATFAIGIRPLRYEVNVKPGNSIKGEVTVVNETDKDIIAEPIIQVFYKNDEAGLPIYLTKEEQLKQNKIENFLSWIDISSDKIPVSAKGAVNVPYTVNVPKKAIAGGKYATIAFQPVKEPTDGISINVRAASLLYVNVEGKIIRSGELTYFGLPKKPLDDPPFTLDISFQNTGNIHLKPTGWIELADLDTGKKLTSIAEYTDPVSGKMVVSDKIPINFNNGSVLPGSLRTFKAEWTKNVKAGRYLANMSLVYAEDSTPITKSFEFTIDKGLELDTAAPNQKASDGFVNEVAQINHGRFFVAVCFITLTLALALGTLVLKDKRKGQKSKRKKRKS